MTSEKPLTKPQAQPPAATRFKKGQSGNPAGRPKKAVVPQPSAFDLLIDRPFTINQGGGRRLVSVDEALQHKLYQDALAGNRAARREVLKMINKREKAIAARQTPGPSPGLQFEHNDPDNAEPALLILGIAVPDPRWVQVEGEGRRLLLEPWAVQTALSRRGRKPLDGQGVMDVERSTLNAEKLVWPRGEKL